MKVMPFFDIREISSSIWESSVTTCTIIGVSFVNFPNTSTKSINLGADASFLHLIELFLPLKQEFKHLFLLREWKETYHIQLNNLGFCRCVVLEKLPYLLYYRTSRSIFSKSHSWDEVRMLFPGLSTTSILFQQSTEGITHQLQEYLLISTNYESPLDSNALSFLA